MLTTLGRLLRLYRTGLAEMTGGGLIIGSLAQFPTTHWGLPVGGIVGGVGLLLKAMEWDFSGEPKRRNR